MRSFTLTLSYYFWNSQTLNILYEVLESAFKPAKNFITEIINKLSIKQREIVPFINTCFLILFQLPFPNNETKI